MAWYDYLFVFVIIDLTFWRITSTIKYVAKLKYKGGDQNEI